MGSLYVVATPIGNLSDMTFRAVETLKMVDLILAEDTRITMKLLNHYEIKHKIMSYNKLNEMKKAKYIINQIENGKNVAIVTDAGTPCISDPGYYLISELRNKNLDVIDIPGACAMVAGLSISGISSTEFSFYGFLPRKDKELKLKLKEISVSKINTLIFYESPHRILNLLQNIEEFISSSKVCVCNDLTKKHEYIYYGDINTVINALKNNPKFEKGEYVVIVEKIPIEVKIDIDELDDIILETMNQSKSSIKELSSVIAGITGKGKNEIYKRILELKNK